MNPFWEPSLNISIKRSEPQDGEPEGRVGENTSYLGRSLNSRQLWMTGSIMAVCFFVLIGRAFALQIVGGNAYRSLADGNRLKTETIFASRGLLYDRFGRQLSENVPTLSLTLIPNDLPKDLGEQERIIQEVSKAIGFEAESIKKMWDDVLSRRPSSTHPYVVVNNLPLESGPSLRVLSKNWPGVEIIVRSIRNYSMIDEGVSSLSNILGYVGPVAEGDLAGADSNYSATDVIGKSGLEFNYEKILRGENGKREVEINALGQEQQLLAEIPPQNGSNIWLTLDLDLQKVAGDALNEGLRRARTQRGAIVIMDPRNGEILSLVSHPSFNANDFSRGLSSEDYATLQSDPDTPMFNRATQGLYPSGSTIKPLLAAAALHQGLITPVTKYLSIGGFSIGPSFFPDWKAGGHGWTDVRRALAESVNTFFYIIGGGYDKATGLGIDKINEYAHHFGLGEKTGVDLPNESDGLVPDPAWKASVKKTPWYIGDTYHVSIGQGDLLVTPLQIANYVSAIANDGTLFQPHFLLETADTGNDNRQRLKSIVRRQLSFKKEDLKVVREGMRQAVTSGSAVALASLPVSTAGKTGTAQVGGRDPHAWFVGFAPYDSPQLVVVVLLENAGEGSTYAVPVAKEILEWWSKERFEN